MRKTILTILVVWVAPAHTFAKVRVISFDELVQRSEIIVVAKVESVTRPLIGKPYAKGEDHRGLEGYTDRANRVPRLSHLDL